MSKLDKRSKEAEADEATEERQAGPLNPIVGCPVHYFTDNPKEQRNGVGRGPYAAVVTQVFANDVCNLKILPPMGPDFDAGSVEPETAASGVPRGRFWAPPRRGPY